MLNFVTELTYMNCNNECSTYDIGMSDRPVSLALSVYSYKFWSKAEHFIMFSLYFRWSQKCDFTSWTCSTCELTWTAFRLINRFATNVWFANKWFFWTVIQSNRLFVWWICLAVKLWILNNTAILSDCLQYCNTIYLTQSIISNEKLNIKWRAWNTFD